MENNAGLKEKNTKFRDFPVILEHSTRPPYAVELLLIFLLGVASTKACDLIPDIAMGEKPPQVNAMEVHIQLDVIPRSSPSGGEENWQYIEDPR